MIFELYYIMSKILVTGGAGFIGSAVAKKMIEKGYEAIIVDNLNDYYNPKLKKDRLDIFLKDYNFDFYQIDIGDIDALKKIFREHKFDAIIHLAAQAGVRYSLTNPWIYEKSNVLGTLNLLELAKENNIGKFILASSSSVYGGNVKQPFYEEDRIEKPISVYAATKISKEMLARTYHHLYGLRIVTLRFFTVYGPWGRPDMAYFKFADLIRAQKPIDIYNNGKMKRDFTYIDDVVQGVAAALEKELDFEIINLGNDQPEELGKFVKLLEEYLGQEAQKNYLPLQPGDVLSTWADIGKARKLLNYDPRTSIEEGLKKFVDWHNTFSHST